MAVAARGSAERSVAPQRLGPRSPFTETVVMVGNKPAGEREEGWRSCPGKPGAADGCEGGDLAEKYLGEPADHQAQLHG